jgi:S1-C subfamily serine protease
MAQPVKNVFHDFDQALAAAVATAGRSTVRIPRGHGAAGTGVVWSEDLVISANFHTPDTVQLGVPAPDRAGDHAELELRDAEVIGRDPGSDLALLRVAGGGLTPAGFRDLAGLAVGNLALALGRPGRSVRAQLRAIGVLGPSIRTPHGGMLDHYIESDRPIPRGFAGGPLVDAEGGVIGMNTRTLIRGCDIAVPTATLRRVVDQLAAHGGVQRGYLGVAAFPAQLSPALAQLVGRDRGALVASVEDAGPAGQAGVIAGDILAELAGAPITGPDSLRLAVGDRPGETVELTVVRGGAKLVVSVTLGRTP